MSPLRGHLPAHEQPQVACFCDASPSQKLDDLGSFIVCPFLVHYTVRDLSCFQSATYGRISQQWPRRSVPYLPFVLFVSLPSLVFFVSLPSLVFFVPHLPFVLFVPRLSLCRNCLSSILLPSPFGEGMGGGSLYSSSQLSFHAPTGLMPLAKEFSLPSSQPTSVRGFS